MITIHTYADLKHFIKAFKNDSFDLLILISEGGLGKTYNTRKILNSKAHCINSHITPLELYLQAFEFKDKKLWLDDVEDMFNNDKLVGLLKQLCETQEIKDIQYGTSWDIDKTRKVPKNFETNSQVIMTVNSINRIQNKGIMALLDRGIIVNFKPSNNEITTYVKENFERYDKEVLQFLNESPSFSLRSYIKCCQLKGAGFKNWKELMTKKPEQIAGEVHG